MDHKSSYPRSSKPISISAGNHDLFAGPLLFPLLHLCSRKVFMAAGRSLDDDSENRFFVCLRPSSYDICVAPAFAITSLGFPITARPSSSVAPRSARHQAVPVSVGRSTKCATHANPSAKDQGVPASSQSTPPHLQAARVRDRFRRCWLSPNENLDDRSHGISFVVIGVDLGSKLGFGLCAVNRASLPILLGTSG